jgi:pimeloyl-ACP methyl ester carboxylesterase
MQHTECIPNVNWLEQCFELPGVTLGSGTCSSANTAAKPRIVLLHGVTRQWRDYAGVMPALAAFGPVTALDHRGHGASSHHHASYRVADLWRTRSPGSTPGLTRPSS